MNTTALLNEPTKIYLGHINKCGLPTRNFVCEQGLQAVSICGSQPKNGYQILFWLQNECSGHDFCEWLGLLVVWIDNYSLDHVEAVAVSMHSHLSQ